MKKILLYSLMLVLMATMSTSCSDDKEENDGVDKNILFKKWTDESQSIEFKKNGDFTMVYDKQTFSGVYKIIDSAHTDNWNGEKMTATWFIIDLTDSSDTMQWLAVYDHKEDALLVFLMENGIRERINSFYFR